MPHIVIFSLLHVPIVIEIDIPFYLLGVSLTRVSLSVVLIDRLTLFFCLTKPFIFIVLTLNFQSDQFGLQL